MQNYLTLSQSKACYSAQTWHVGLAGGQHFFEAQQRHLASNLEDVEDDLAGNFAMPDITEDTVAADSYQCAYQCAYLGAYLGAYQGVYPDVYPARRKKPSPTSQNYFPDRHDPFLQPVAIKTKQ